MAKTITLKRILKIKKKNSVDDEKSLCYAQIEKEIKSKNKSVNLLASTVKIRPNTIENKEFRIRHRYAVIAGLVESGYKASEPNRLRFCTLQNLDKDNKVKVYDLRWERFTYEGTDKDSNKPDDIILIWIDSDAVTDSNFFQMLVGLFQKYEEISAKAKNLYIFDWVSSINKEDFEKNMKK